MDIDVTALKGITRERGIPLDYVIDAIEQVNSMTMAMSLENLKSRQKVSVEWPLDWLVALLLSD
mgnify:CR=1 FL=1